MGDEVRTEAYCEEQEDLIDQLAGALQEAEWMACEWDYGGCESVCGWCWEHQPFAERSPGFHGPIQRAATRHHKPGCSYVALMRRVGVGS